MINIESLKDRLLGNGNIHNRFTMITRNSLTNIEECLKDCIANGVEGDYVETGVWKGGSCILAHSVTENLDRNRSIWAFDSFEGLPPPDPASYPVDQGDTHHLLKELSISLEDVKHNFSLFEGKDTRVNYVKGWFRDTLPNNKVDKIAVLRLDGDMYESTILALDNLYPKLSMGGYCIIDDYIHKGARAAVDFFRSKHGIEDEILLADKAPGAYPVSYWRKSK